MDILIFKGLAHELFPDGAPELHEGLQVVRDYSGEVYVGWSWTGSEFVDPVTTEELADAARAKRNARLLATDWWETRGEATEEQLVYRQALRDITTQSSFPHHVDWPIDPTLPAPDSYENALLP